MLGDARIALHQRVQIVRIEDQKIGTGCRRNGRGAFALLQDGDFAEELAGREPDTLLRQIDLHFARGDEIHRMPLFPAPDDHVTRVESLRFQ